MATRPSLRLAQAEVPAGKVDVVIRIRMDEAKLDAYVRRLYDEDEEVPDEPRVGVGLAREWANMADDLAVWGDPENDYVDAVAGSVEVPA